jgi:hypothetical protein
MLFILYNTLSLAKILSGANAFEISDIKNMKLRAR